MANESSTTPLSRINRRQMLGTTTALVGGVFAVSGWIKVVDSLIGEVPIVGMFTGYFFNPSYLVTTVSDVPIARLAKQPAFFEGKFQMTKLGEISQQEEDRVMLSLLTMTLLERSRG